MLSFAVSVFHLKLQNNLCSGSKRTLNFNLRIMKNCSMLHNGKSKSGALLVFSAGEVGFVKSFPDFFQTVFGNTDSGILDRDKYFVVLPLETVTSTSPSLRLYLIALSQRL